MYICRGTTGAPKQGVVILTHVKLYLCRCICDRCEEGRTSGTKSIPAIYMELKPLISNDLLGHLNSKHGKKPMEGAWIIYLTFYVYT